MCVYYNPFEIQLLGEIISYDHQAYGEELEVNYSTVLFYRLFISEAGSILFRFLIRTLFCEIFHNEVLYTHTDASFIHQLCLRDITHPLLVESCVQYVSNSGIMSLPNPHPHQLLLVESSLVQVIPGSRLKNSSSSSLNTSY